MIAFLIILLILAILFPKGIKAILYLGLFIFLVSVLWGMSWWGKLIDIFIAIVFIFSLIGGSSASDDKKQIKK